MNFEDAHRIFQRILAPLSLEEFLDNTLGKRFVKIPNSAESDRTNLLGPNPEQLILDAFEEIAPTIGYHALKPLSAPPAIEPVANSQAFKAKIETFHSRGYTVRLPQPRGLAPKLDEFLRSLEFFFHEPASAEAFWSRGDARAPAHHDDYDLIAIQLRGRKRWFISTDLSELPNPWRDKPNAKPGLERCQEVVVEPGDLLYLPRGTDHRVDALADSLHLSIGFVPLTLREAIAATVDHLSELDRTFRDTAVDRLAYAVRDNDFKDLPAKVRDGLAQLLKRCDSDEFIVQAMQRRSSRAIHDLKKSKMSAHPSKISPDTLVRHGPSSICHILVVGSNIDFSHPGGHIYIHSGVAESVKFIADTSEFRVRDIPGAVGDDIRVALVEKFLASGFLEVAKE